MKRKTLYYLLTYLIVVGSVVISCEKDSPTKELNPVITLNTGTVSNISHTTCTVNGTISSVGEGITQYGFCWSNSSTPTINDSKTELGAKASPGSFSATLTDLAPDTDYFVRAYAQSNNAPPKYGESVPFKTMAYGVPLVTTNDVSNISTESATCGGNISDDGGSAITERGVCWSTTENPTISDSKTTDGSGTGPFTSELTDLGVSTTYYVKAYATNIVGTAYGDQVEFTTKAYDPPTISAPATSTGTFTVAISYSDWPYYLSNWDTYQLEESTVSSSSGFELIHTSANTHTSPYNVQLTRASGTYYYRARITKNTPIGYSYYSNVATVVVTEPVITTIELLPFDDNVVIKNSDSENSANTVYATSDLAVGNNFVDGYYVDRYTFFETFIKFSLPSETINKTILNATLKLYVRYIAAEPWETTYKIAASANYWSGNSITWNNSRGLGYYTSNVYTFDPPVSGSIPVEIDLTSIVQNWVNGNWDNNGLRLWDFNYPYPFPTSYRATVFWSKDVYDNINHRPTLEIEYE